MSLGVTGVAGVPGGASGIAMNITVTQSWTSGFLTVFPGNVGLPVASNVNFEPGQTVPNLVIVGVPTNGIVKIYTSGGPVHVIADIVGWYDADRATESGRFVPREPVARARHAHHQSADRTDRGAQPQGDGRRPACPRSARARSS